MVYVVIACHFRTQMELCGTTVARLRAAYNTVKEGDQILVTGDVPYAPGGPTLGKLMRDWLVSGGLSAKRISILDNGFGTFSEARIVCARLQEEKAITVISSHWYFFPGKPIWLRRGRDNGISVSFLSVPGTGGWRTWLAYAVIGVIVRAAISTGLERILEDRLTASQEKRREGFRFDGCR